MCSFTVVQKSPISKIQKVNEPGRLYFDVTCRFTLYWAFGDALDLWLAALRQFNIITLLLWIYNRLPWHLKGIVRSSEDGLFYLFPIQSLSTLQEMKGHLTCAIDVLSNPDENDTEKRLDAVRTLNSLVAALSVNDGDYYDAIDIAFEEIRE